MRHLAFAVWAVMGALLISPLNAAPGGDNPTEVVQALYRHEITHFGFDPDIVKAAKPWLAPGLYARLWKKANEPVPKGDAPDIEGDVFLNCQDDPTRFEVEPAVIEGDKATVEVRIYFDEEKRLCTVLLKHIDGAWKVSDVDYGKDGKLTDLL